MENDASSVIADDTLFAFPDFSYQRGGWKILLGFLGPKKSFFNLISHK
jgi:hypothetical protein